MASSRTIKACLFDMDGLLINSEDIYTISLTKVLETYGKPPLTWDLKIKLQGRPGPSASKLVIEHYDLPLTPEELFAKTTAVQMDLWPTVKFLPGALELLQYLDTKKIPFALATSSHKLNYDRKTGHLQHGFDLFRHHIVTGDDSRIPPGKGKPFPDIWFAALESLNKERKQHGQDTIDITECLVFEDGVPGVEAGKASGAYVIWVPDERALKVLAGKEKEIIGENNEHGIILKSLEAFDKTMLGS